MFDGVLSGGNNVPGFVMDYQRGRLPNYIPHLHFQLLIFAIIKRHPKLHGFRSSRLPTFGLFLLINWRPQS